jgi:hypothetical protein
LPTRGNSYERKHGERVARVPYRPVENHRGLGYRGQSFQGVEKSEAEIGDSFPEALKLPYRLAPRSGGERQPREACWERGTGSRLAPLTRRRRRRRPLPDEERRGSRPPRTP